MHDFGIWCWQACCVRACCGGGQEFLPRGAGTRWCAAGGCREVDSRRPWWWRARWRAGRRSCAARCERCEKARWRSAVRRQQAGCETYGRRACRRRVHFARSGRRSERRCPANCCEVGRSVVVRAWTAGGMSGPGRAGRLVPLCTSRRPRLSTAISAASAHLLIRTALL